MRHFMFVPVFLGLAMASVACQTTQQIPAKSAKVDSAVTTDEAAPETTAEYALYEPGSINDRILARGQKSRQTPSLSYMSEDVE